MTKRLILASKSPRRQELLHQVRIPFSVRTMTIDESKITTNNPYEKVTQLAALKGKAISLQHKDEVVLSADTIVAFNGRIFEKPNNKAEAYEMITTLSNDIHKVYTGIMIRSNDYEVTFVEKTEVQFWPLCEREIESYVTTDEPYDKAGAYGIQSIGAMFVKQIVGDYYNVVGLPLSRVVRELKDFGVKVIE